MAYLDTLGTRAEDAVYKRMRLVLTSAHRADEVDPLADAERADLAHLAEVEDQRRRVDGGGQPAAVERLVDGAGQLQAGEPAVGEALEGERRWRR